MSANIQDDVRNRLNALGPNDTVEQRDAAWLGAIDAILAHFACVVGTIHRLDPMTQTLHLLVRRGIPDAILERVSRIPVGKGMAGLAAERQECVEVCNLQTDASGDAKPGAKLTGMEGSIAVPMLVDGRVVGVLGVAKPTAYNFTEPERRTLLALAAEIGRAFDNPWSAT